MKNPNNPTPQSPHEEEIRLTCDHLGNTLIRKNRDYGDATNFAPVLAQGVSYELAMRIRISDKLKRLESLFNNKDPNPNYESILDTLLDVAGYCVLYHVGIGDKVNKTVNSEQSSNIMKSDV